MLLGCHLIIKSFAFLNKELRVANYELRVTIFARVTSSFLRASYKLLIIARVNFDMRI